MWSFPKVDEIRTLPGWVPSNIAEVNFLSDDPDPRLPVIAAKLRELNSNINPYHSAWEAASHPKGGELGFFFSLAKKLPPPPSQEHIITPPTDWEKPHGALVCFDPNISPGRQALRLWPPAEMDLVLVQ
jgi:hypothetical protein